MTANDLDRSLQDWFDAVEPRTVPQEILSSVFTVTRRVGQRRGLLGQLKQIGGVGALGERMNRFVLVAGGTTALAVAVIGVAYLFGAPPNVGVPVAPTASPSPPPITGSLPAEQSAVIARHAAALNSRDAEAFVDVFADNGAFNPRGTFAASSSLFRSDLPIADRSLVESFVAINEAWRFEAEVLACDQLSKSEYQRRYGVYDDSDLYGHCAVKSRWPALSLEIGEWWTYEFNGTDIRYWGQAVRDATPASRALPLGLDGLLDWESWLGATDPDAAARLLNPRELPVTVPCGPCEFSSDDVDVERIISSEGYGRGEDDWLIAGKRFHPSALIPYDQALADDIEASINEFLGEREGLP